MGKLQRYIGGQLLVAMLGVLLLIVGLDALSTVIDELEYITDTYTFIDVLVYVGFTLPRRAHEFVPFAALIGALVGLGKLASSSELTVAQTSGLSLRQIGMMVLQPALLLALGGFALGEFVTPLSEQLAVSHRALAQRQEQGFVGAAGVWSRDGGTFVHVEAVQRQGVIYGVQLLSFDSERRLTQSVRAERGSFQEGYWLLEQVEKTVFSPTSTQVERQTTAQWETEITPQLLALEAVDSVSLPTRQLWPYARYLESQGLLFRDIELAFWRKLLQPLAIGGLVLVAMSFIFGPLRSGTMGARIFAGVIVGIVFRISEDFFGPISLIYGFPSILSAATPIALCWLCGLWLLRRKA